MIWNVAAGTLTAGTVTITSQSGNSRGLFFKPDGTKMFVSDRSNSHVFQYTLGTPWDLTTVSYTGVSFAITPQDTSCTGLHFSPDGSRMYVPGGDFGSSVYQYALATPWSLATASYTGLSINAGLPVAVFLSSDGRKMFTVSGATSLHEWHLATPWDISTAVDSGISIAAPGTSTGLAFTPDGRQAFIPSASTGNSVAQFDLPNRWSLVNATQTRTLNISSEGSSAGCLAISDNAHHFMFVADFGSHTVFRWLLGYAGTPPSAPGVSGKAGFFRYPTRWPQVADRLVR